MSTYLHVIPTNNTEMRKSFELSNNLSFDGLAEYGRMPTSEEFEHAISLVEPYEYELRKDGSISLRQGSTEDLYKIINEVVEQAGPQVVFNDNMVGMIFTNSISLDEFKSSVLFSD